MAIIQSDYATGKKETHQSVMAGDVMFTRFQYEFATQLNSADILELGVLPAGCVPVPGLSTMITEANGGNFTGLTANVGIMSGEVGSTDAGRTLGTEFFAAVDLAAAATNPVVRLQALLNLAPSELNRSIGFQASGNIVALAGKKVTLLLGYVNMRGFS